MGKNAFFWGVLLVLQAGCRPPVEQRELTFWYASNPAEGAFAREHVAAWNRRHPGQAIAARPVPEGQSSEEIILASVVGHTTPDVYANLWQGDVERYAKAKVLVAFDTLRGFMDFLRTRCDSAVIREITSSDGHIYQVPWKVNPIMTIYNPTALASVGERSLPLTYAGYLRAGKRFQRDFNGDGYADRWLGYTEVRPVWHQRLFNFYPLYLAASNGGALIQNNRAAFNNPAAVAVFRFLQALYRANYFPKEKLSATRDPFIAEKIALKFTGPWDVSFLERYKNEGFEYDTGPMPVPEGHPGLPFTYADPKNIVIFNTCSRPQQAWDFIRTMVEKSGDRRLLELTGQFPRRSGLDTDPFFQPFFAKNPRLLPFARQTKRIRGVDNCEVIVEVFEAISQEYEACVLYNRKTPEAAVADAARAVDVLLGN